VREKILVEKLEFGPRLTELEPEWEALLRNSSHPSIFSTFDYVYTSCKHFKGEEEVFFLFFRDSQTNELLAIFPIGVWNDQMYGLNLKVVTHGVMPETSEVDKPYPIIARNYEDVCWKRFRDYFRQEYRQWDLIDYDEFLPDSDLHGNLTKFFPFPFYHTRTKPGPQSPIVKLDGDWEDFWGQHRKLRKKCRRLERTLADGLSYRITNDAAEVDACLNAYVEMEISSWKKGEIVAQKRAFYQELLPKLAEKKQLYFGIMHDGPKVVSIEVAYTFMDRVYFCHGTYSPEYAELSPGVVNSCWFIKSFHERGFAEGDYLAGFADYVTPWAYRQEETVDIVIRRMGWKNGYLALRYLATKAKAKLRSVLASHSKRIGVAAAPQPEAEL
jgi:hypothetical protein